MNFPEFRMLNDRSWPVQFRARKNERDLDLDFEIQSSGIHSTLWYSRSCSNSMPDHRQPKVSPENTGDLMTSLIQNELTVSMCDGATSNVMSSKEYPVRADRINDPV